MERIILRHLSGSKANQVDEFPLNHIKEMVLGRDPSATVKYDPDRDDLVGRQHARIAQDLSDPTQFTITDLNSRNGTFVNKQRIVSATKIGPGDTIQLGPGGPEFQFDLEPRPQNVVKATRTAVSPEASTAPPTRTIDTGGSGVSAPPSVSSAATPGSVGKATVERMIFQTKRSESRKFLVIGGAALVAVLVLFGGVAGFLIWRSRVIDREISDFKKPTPDPGLRNPEQIVKANGNAVVKIEVSWRLISPNGGLVYHQYLPNKKPDGKPLMPGGPAYIPFYVRTQDGAIEPYLTYDGNPNSVAIGGAHAGSGFVVSSDGFILTNRHVAAAWKTVYDFPASANIGIVFGPDKRAMVGTVSQAPTTWVPAATRQELSGGFDGRNDRLDVTFPNTDGRIAAQLVRPSDRHDVALVKISIPDSAPKVEINDNYDVIQPGAATIVLGYPAVSPPVFGIVRSQDVFNRGSQLREIPDPTVSVGNVGRVLRGREASGSKEGIYSIMGDAYQLTINSTGAGNSGGPVFDSGGRVIGIFFASRRTDAAISFAVPIRYGKELMSVTAPPR